VTVDLQHTRETLQFVERPDRQFGKFDEIDGDQR